MHQRASECVGAATWLLQPICIMSRFLKSLRGLDAIRSTLLIVADVQARQTRFFFVQNQCDLSTYVNIVNPPSKINDTGCFRKGGVGIFRSDREFVFALQLTHLVRRREKSLFVLYINRLLTVKKQHTANRSHFNFVKLQGTSDLRQKAPRLRAVLVYDRFNPTLGNLKGSQYE